MYFGNEVYKFRYDLMQKKNDQIKQEYLVDKYAQILDLKKGEMVM